MVVCILSSTNCCRRERISLPIAWGNTYQYTNSQTHSQGFGLKIKTLDKTLFYMCIYNSFIFVPQNNTIWGKKNGVGFLWNHVYLFFYPYQDHMRLKGASACSAPSCIAQNTVLPLAKIKGSICSIHLKKKRDSSPKEKIVSFFTPPFTCHSKPVFCYFSTVHFK